MELKNKVQYLLSADWHFGHKNMEKLCYRPEFFEDLIQENLVAKVNALTKDGHEIILYNLGDVVWNKGGWEKVKKINEDLNQCCLENILVRGNHDKLTVVQFTQMGFTRVLGGETISGHRVGSNKSVNLSHQPTKIPGYTNVHGHLHNNLPIVPSGILISQELCDYRAITLEEVLNIGATPKWNGEKFVSAYNDK